MQAYFHDELERTRIGKFMGSTVAEGKRKKVVVLASSLIEGGAERRAADLANQLSKREYDVHLITLSRGLSFGVHDKVKVIRISDLDGHMNKLLKIVSSPFQIKKLKKVLRSIEPDFVISYLIKANFCNVLLKNKIGYKSFVSVRTYPSKALKTGWRSLVFKRVLRFIVKKADKVFANSLATRRDLKENFGSSLEKTFTIYNPYDIDEIRQLSREKVDHPWFKGKVPIYITAGRLEHQKGQWHLLRAFARLKKEKSARLVILGEGKLEKYLKGLTDKLNLKDSVLFLGWKDNPYKYVARSTVFVFPSLFEGFPNSMAEAMICGVPVIASDCFSGPRELSSGGDCARLVRPGSRKLSGAGEALEEPEKELYREMKHLLENKSLREKLSKKAYKRMSRFSQKRIIDEYEEHLRS